MVRLIARQPLALVLTLLMILLVYPLAEVRIGFAPEEPSKLFEQVVEADRALEFPVKLRDTRYIIRDESTLDCSSIS